MTDRTWLGGGNNHARNPNDWSPAGAPQPGDTLSMLNGTMNVRDDDLAGNAVHVGDPITGGQDTFNLSHHPVLAVVQQNQDTSSETTVNVSGRDTLRFSTTFPSGPQLDFGHSSSIAGDVYQAVECDVGEFVDIVYLTRRFKIASGP